MNSKSKNILLTSLALILYIGFMIGIGFIWDLFWTVNTFTAVIYWVSKGIVCLMVVVFALIMVLGKADKGVNAMQLFFSLSLSLLPIALRAICMIPYAGKWIAIVIGFILICVYGITLIMLSAYDKGEGTKKI